jgi:protein ImuB
MKRILTIWFPNLPGSLPPWWDEGDAKPIKKLAQWCQRFAPQVGVEAEALLLDVTNLAPLYGSEQRMLREIRQEMQQVGLHGRGVLASTIGAAWGIARYGLKPWALVPDAKTRVFLAPLPVNALRLPVAISETLGRLGVERIGELLELPRDQLRSRFGPLLLTRIDQALGTISETFVSVEPPLEFVAGQTLEFSLADREAIRSVVADHLERLARSLAVHCRGALRIVCRLDCEGATPAVFEAGWFQPTADPRRLLEVVELELEQLRLAAATTAITLTVVRHAALAERQVVLFDQERRLGRSRPLAQLVDRLVGRLGEKRVVRCGLLPEAQPEFAYARTPLINGMPRPRKNSSRKQSLGALDRPLHLLRRPEPLTVIASVPVGPPVRFSRYGQQHHISGYAGPERIETGWWRGRSAWRDYYRVETTEGRRFWLFRRRQDGRWFLHGVYG